MQCPEVGTELGKLPVAVLGLCWAGAGLCHAGETEVVSDTSDMGTSVFCKPVLLDLKLENWRD